LHQAIKGCSFHLLTQERPWMLANLKIICQFHAYSVHQNSVEIFWVEIYRGRPFLGSAKWAIFIAIPWWEQVIFQWYDDDVCFVPRLTLLVEFYSTNSLKQQSDSNLTSLLPAGLPKITILGTSNWLCKWNVYKSSSQLGYCLKIFKGPDKIWGVLGYLTTVKFCPCSYSLMPHAQQWSN
jgi:hypothetical protein